VPRQSKPQFYYIRDLIDRYAKEIGTVRPFGKNKAAVLKTLTAALGRVPLSGLTAARLSEYFDARRVGGAGVTVGIVRSTSTSSTLRGPTTPKP
jgi:hypothetical protein